MEEDVGITFDEEFNIRVFDKEKMNGSVELRVQTDEFVKKLSSFKENLSNVLEIIESQRDTIEQEKKKAIGVRNLVNQEIETREMKKRELQRVLMEKNRLMEKYNEELNHLLKVEAHQKQVIDMLSNNEPISEGENF